MFHGEVVVGTVKVAAPPEENGSHEDKPEAGSDVL